MKHAESAVAERLGPLGKVAAGVYTEAELGALAREFAGELRAGDRVLLEGPLGAGKTTFARFLLEALGVHQPPEGSPTFALAHEYDAEIGRVVHIDCYRLKSESELEDSGLHEHFWNRERLVIAEWTSMWPEFRASLERKVAGHRNWQVSLAPLIKDHSRREVKIS